MYITVRKVVYNSNEIMLQRRFWWGFVLPVWRDWKLLNNELYSKDMELEKAVEKIKKLYSERKEIEAWLKAESKEIGDSKRYRKGVSEPFEYRVSGFRASCSDYFFKRYPDFNPVNGSWRGILSKEFLGGKTKAPGLRGEMGIPDHKTSGTTAYIPKEMESWKISLNSDEAFDQVIPFRESNSNNNSNKSSRKRRSGESNQDHQDRLRNMDEGNGGSDY